MYKLFFFLFLALQLSQPSSACTSFFINKDGQLIFGRNYDWISGQGMLFTNLRGLQKTSMRTEDGNTISWVSKYGSITFNQYGKEFPTGGMNEKGLVVELMWLDGTAYPATDDRPSIGTLQWIQYQLDNAATVEEVIASDKILRISKKGTVPLHFLIADANGRSATIEFLEGKMIAYRGNELPLAVLTNDTYASAYKITRGTVGNSFSSLDRFGQACRMVEQFQQGNISKPVVDYSFDILKKVAQGDWTKWSIVYDISNRKIYFKSLDASTIKNISFNAFNFDCKSASQMFNINEDLAGNVSGSFSEFSIRGYQSVLENAILESQTRVMITDKRKEELLNYARLVGCR